MEQRRFKVGDVVKLSKPQDQRERDARFVVEELNGDRGMIRLVCDLPIPPLELVLVSDIEFDSAGGSWLETRIRSDFEEWSGGFPPVSRDQIESYVEASRPADTAEDDVRQILQRWMDEHND